MPQKINPATLAPKTQTIILPVIIGVQAGATAYLDLPLGVRYHAIYLQYGGTTFTPANITQVRVKVNGTVVWALPGSFLDTMNQFDKMQAASTYNTLALSFERIGLKSASARWSTALNTGKGVLTRAVPQGITSLRLEFDINGTAVAPTLVATAKISANNPAQGAWLMRREIWYENVAVVGQYLHQHKYNQDPLRPMMSRMFFGDTPANITAFDIQANRQEIINRTSTLNEHIQTVDNLRAPQAGQVVWDTGEDGISANMLNVGSIADLEIRTTHAAVNNALPVMAESLGYLT